MFPVDFPLGARQDPDYRNALLLAIMSIIVAHFRLLHAILLLHYFGIYMETSLYLLK